MNRLPAAALAVIAFCAAAKAAAAQDSTPPADVAAQSESARRRAAELAAAGEFAKAEETLKDAEKRLGPSAALTAAEGEVLLLKSKAEDAGGADEKTVTALRAEATSRAKAALATDPDCSAAIALLARIRAAEHDGKGARADLAAAIEKKPKDVVLRAALAEMLFALRDWAGAQAQYAKILEVRPDDGVARLNDTVARQRLGAAAAELEKGFLEAARLLPESDKAVQCLVDLYPKDREKKLALLKKAIAANPRAVAARVWLAEVLRKSEPPDPKAAFAALREAEALAPKNASIHSSVAELLEAEGDVVNALEEYAAAVENSGPGAAERESDAIDRLLHADSRADKISREAREHAYDVLVAKNPDEGRYGNNAGFWCREAHEYEKSLKYYLAAVKASPDDQNFLNDTGLIYLFHVTAEKDKCLPLFEKVLDLVRRGHEPQRGYWDTLENLCKYWFEKGEFKKVVEYADKRADSNASVGGKPYPSGVAAEWKVRAMKELEKK